MTLHEIRLSLRGPIASHPFSLPPGTLSGKKIAYCKRQIALLNKWYYETGECVFRGQIIKWQNLISKIMDGKL